MNKLLTILSIFFSLNGCVINQNKSEHEELTRATCAVHNYLNNNKIPFKQATILDNHNYVTVTLHPDQKYIGGKQLQKRIEELQLEPLFNIGYALEIYPVGFIAECSNIRLQDIKL